VSVVKTTLLYEWDGVSITIVPQIKMTMQDAVIVRLELQHDSNYCAGYFISFTLHIIRFV